MSVYNEYSVQPCTAVARNTVLVEVVLYDVTIAILCRTKYPTFNGLQTAVELRNIQNVCAAGYT